MDIQFKWYASYVADLGCNSVSYLPLARGNLGCIVKSLTNGWPHPEHPTVANELGRDPLHERVLIYSGLNQSKLANLVYSEGF